MILLLYLMFGQVNLDEWYNNYYWMIFAGYQNNRNYVGVFLSDAPFSVYDFDTGLRFSGITHYYKSSSVSSAGSANINFIASHINVSEPASLSTYSNQTYFKGDDQLLPKFSNFDVKYTNGNTYLAATNPQIVNPVLTNTQTDLENLSFNNFNIEAHSYSNQDVYMFFYNRSLTNSLTTDGLYPISTKLLTREAIYYDTTNSTEENAIYNVPIWKTGVLFNVGSTYEIRFAIINGFDDESNTPLYSYIGDTYNFTISSSVTQDYINQLNQQTATDTSQENFDNIQNSINNQSQSIDNINNTITDSTVDNSSIELPTDNTSDPTQSGVDNIFQAIYNSFTSGTPQNIVFPIPFTNKNITLEPNYIYNMLNNNGASWVITIIQAFWWYLISRFIITDIMKKIRKIKQGNFDNIQNSNIKEDML